MHSFLKKELAMVSVFIGVSGCICFKIHKDLTPHLHRAEHLITTKLLSIYLSKDLTPHLHRAEHLITTKLPSIYLSI